YSATHETPAHQTSRAPYTTLFRSHMLTREALAEFAEHLAPGGVLAVHVSNRNLELAPMVGATSAEAGLEGVVRYDPNTDTDGGEDRKSTRLNSSHGKTSYAVCCWK